MISSIIFILLSMTSIAFGIPDSTPFKQLVWEEDFNGNGLDRDKWKIQVDQQPCWGGGNGEFQCYTDSQDNVKVADGVVKLTAIPRRHLNKDYTSGKLEGKVGWTYGYFEARARLPKGKHLWPAIWMMPLRSEYGGWPRSGEIDIMEYRGQEATKVAAHIHYGVASNDKSGTGSGMRDFGIDFSRDFHTFGFEWTEERMRWFVDDREYYSASIDRVLFRNYDKKGQPFNRDFFWILNVAVGGGFFPPAYGQLTLQEARHWEKPYMEVDYLRVYKA